MEHTGRFFVCAHLWRAVGFPDAISALFELHAIVICRNVSMIFEELGEERCFFASTMGEINCCQAKEVEQLRFYGCAFSEVVSQSCKNKEAG